MKQLIKHNGLITELCKGAEVFYNHHCHVSEHSNKDGLSPGIWMLLKLPRCSQIFYKLSFFRLVSLSCQTESFPANGQIYLKLQSNMRRMGCIKRSNRSANSHVNSLNSWNTFGYMAADITSSGVISSPWAARSPSSRALKSIGGREAPGRPSIRGRDFRTWDYTKWEDLGNNFKAISLTS